MNYSEKLRRLQERQNPQYGQSLEKCFASMDESTEKEIDTASEYVKRAMAELSERSTKISYEEGEGVKSQLIKELPNYSFFNPDFEYQGSVPCNTHIKYHSDIDLLVIIDKFVTVENKNRIKKRYLGNPKEDMIDLRAACIKILNETYSVADVEKNSKSITISGGSLKRKIDVVPSNWYNSENWYIYKKDYYRGVQIFDNKTKKRITNFPFLNIRRIGKKDYKTHNNYRPLVRLTKNLKEDSDNKIDISSYDIQALFYNMPDKLYFSDTATLLKNTICYLHELINDSYLYQSLTVPDETRKISDKVNITEIDKLLHEFYDLSSRLGIIK